MRLLLRTVAGAVADFDVDPDLPLAVARARAKELLGLDKDPQLVRAGRVLSPEDDAASLLVLGFGNGDTVVAVAPRGIATSSAHVGTPGNAAVCTDAVGAAPGHAAPSRVSDIAAASGADIPSAGSAASGQIADDHAAHAAVIDANAFPNAWAGWTSGATGKNGRRGGRGGAGGGQHGGRGRGDRGRGYNGHGNTKGQGKGKGKNRGNRGRGDWDTDTAPDFDAISEARQAELEQAVVAFQSEASEGVEVVGGEFMFPPSLTALERRFVYAVAERLGGVTVRGIGTGADRRLLLVHGRPNVPAEQVFPNSSSSAKAGLVADVTVANAASEIRSKLPAARLSELESQLRCLFEGREPGARPKVGDCVQVTCIRGADPTHLEGRCGVVVGLGFAVGGGASGGGAVTIRFQGDGAVFGNGLDLTVAVCDVQVIEASLPLGEGSLSFPASLSGLERRVVHEEAERLGFVSQSFGEGSERYITVYRKATVCGVSAQPSAHVDGLSTEAAVPVAISKVSLSGVELDGESTNRLITAIRDVPGNWRFHADRMVVCFGPLCSPSLKGDRRSSANDDLIRQISALHVGDFTELRVVSIGWSSRAVAVGVLGVPAVLRNPHVTVALAPGAGPWEADTIAKWAPWQGEPLVLHGHVAQWGSTNVRHETSQVAVAGDHGTVAKVSCDDPNIVVVASSARTSAGDGETSSESAPSGAIAGTSSVANGNGGDT